MLALLSAVVVERGQAGKHRRLLTADATELGHSNDKRERGALADAGNAQHQIEPPRKVGVKAQFLDDPKHLGCPAYFQAGDVGHDETPQATIADVFEPGLQTGNVLLGLLDEGQMVGKLGQAHIRREPRFLDRGRAGRHQGCIKRIVLGPAQMHPRISAHLDRLQHQDDEACSLQMFHYAALVTARRLDSDTGDAGLGQLRTQMPPTAQAVLNPPTQILTVHCNVELVLGRIDAGHRCANLRHLRRPLPCEANQVVPATIRVR